MGLKQNNARIYRDDVFPKSDLLAHPHPLGMLTSFVNDPIQICPLFIVLDGSQARNKKLSSEKFVQYSFLRPLWPLLNLLPNRKCVNMPLHNNI